METWLCETHNYTMITHNLVTTTTNPSWASSSTVTATLEFHFHTKQGGGIVTRAVS